MCGRFTFFFFKEIEERFGIDMLTYELQPRYNIAPSQMISAIVSDGEKRHMGTLKWGLVPHWAKDESIGYKMINARAETLLEKPAFKNLVSRKRCLIPADGFYEWKRVGTKKQPMRITLKTQEIFAFAGLYDTWTAPNGRKVSSCTIITTTPNELMADIHDRMPVILPREHEDIWLDRSIEDKELVHALLQPYPAEEMRAYPVSAIVGNVRNDGPECVEEVQGAWK